LFVPIMERLPTGLVVIVFFFFFFLAIALPGLA
jgi:hypothetical protein